MTILIPNGVGGEDAMVMGMVIFMLPVTDAERDADIESRNDALALVLVLALLALASVLVSVEDAAGCLDLDVALGGASAFMAATTALSWMRSISPLGSGMGCECECKCECVLYAI